MKRIDRTSPARHLVVLGLVCLPGSTVRAMAAEEEPGEDQIQLIVQFVGDPDRETRAVGLQFIREQAPGKAATERFAALLPDLSPEAQADLLDALGDRQDPAAKPAVLEMLKSPDEAVRAASLRALGSLGTAAEVPLLAERLAGEAGREKDAARQALIRLRGDDVNQAVVAAMGGGTPEARVALLGVLAGRNAKEALPTVLASVNDPETPVRMAALGALRFLADETNTAALVQILKAARDDAERRKAELALLVVCSRGRQACAEAIAAGMADADVPSRIALLHALARAGGPNALEAVVARLKDGDESVRDEAVRVLSIWPDPAAKPHLEAIAKSHQSLRHHVLAIRGLVALASPREEKPADIPGLAQAMSLSKRPDEKRLVLGVAGGVASADALALVLPALDDPALAEEAGLAAVRIAEKMPEGNKEQLRGAMEKVVKLVKSPDIRQRAQKLAE